MGPVQALLAAHPRGRKGKRLPEVEIYLVLLVMVFLIDHQHFQQVGPLLGLSMLCIFPEATIGFADLRSHCPEARKRCVSGTITNLAVGGLPSWSALMHGLCMQCISLAAPLAE